MPSKPKTKPTPKKKPPRKRTPQPSQSKKIPRRKKPLKDMPPETLELSQTKGQASSETPPAEKGVDLASQPCEGSQLPTTREEFVSLVHDIIADSRLRNPGLWTARSSEPAYDQEAGDYEEGEPGIDDLMPQATAPGDMPEEPPAAELELQERPRRRRELPHLPPRPRIPGRRKLAGRKRTLPGLSVDIELLRHFKSEQLRLDINASTLMERLLYAAFGRPRLSFEDEPEGDQEPISTVDRPDLDRC